MALTGTDIAILSARFGVARFGASRFGFCPDDVEGLSTTEPGEYIWKEHKPSETLWELQSLYSFCGQRPVASFTDAPDPATITQDVQFTDTSTPDELISFWYWTFGDGEVSYEQNPIHAYAETGVYTVTLYVAGIRGSDSVTGTVTVVGMASVTGTVTFAGLEGPELWVGVEVSMTVDAIPWAGGTAITNGSGVYLFTGVPAGAIVVSVDADQQSGSNSGTTVPPATLTLNIAAAP